MCRGGGLLEEALLRRVHPDLQSIVLHGCHVLTMAVRQGCCQPGSPTSWHTNACPSASRISTVLGGPPVPLVGHGRTCDTREGAVGTLSTFRQSWDWGGTDLFHIGI